MTATVCHVQSCIHHHSKESCGVDQISVAVQGSRAFCSTYRNHHLYKTGADNDTLDMNTQITSSNPEVGCQAAACFYNQDMVCYAAAIEVFGDNAVDSTETRCNTFLPRDEDDSGVEERFEFGLHVD